MWTKNTALLAGPYDWDTELLPLAEFESRLVAVRRVLAEHRASGLIVHGNSIEHGALAYLTGLTPKLGPAFALVPVDGPIRILVSGGAGMIGSAKLLTWVQDVRPMGNLQESVKAWIADMIPVSRPDIGLWLGTKIAERPYLAVEAGVQRVGATIPMDDRLNAVRVQKSHCELALIREACRVLSSACGAFGQAAAGGAGGRSASLAAERAAFAAGAQDARILASARDGGPPLASCDARDIRCAPLLACIAVRFAGYWAEGLLTVAGLRDGAPIRAKNALGRILRGARPGMSGEDLRQLAELELAPYKTHPIVESSIGNGIGLSLEEAPWFSPGKKARLEPGGVYSIRCGAAGEGVDNALVSSMIAVGANAIQVLWPPEESSPTQEAGASNP